MEYLAYTYIIKCPNGKSYYGYRSANKVSPEDDLWKNYFTSSKCIKELREQYSDDEFIATIDKTFESAEEAYEYETKFLTENDCVKSDDWLNQQCFPVFVDGYNKGHIPWNKGKAGVITKAARKKMSEAKKGHIPWNKGKTGIFTEAVRKKMSEAHKGVKLSEEHRKKLSKAGKGRVFSEEHKKKLSEASQRKLKNGFVPWIKGKKHSEETKKKISEARQRQSQTHKRKPL